MKKITFIFFIFIANSFSISAQENEAKIHTFVQDKARPKEGMQAFIQNFMNEFNSHDVPKGTKELSMRIKFIVEKDGTFSNVEVLNDTSKVANEAIRVLNSMPPWTPSKHNGEYVRSSFILPIRIKLKNSKAKTLSIKQKKIYLKSLNQNKINTDFFDLTCNCAIVRSSTNNELQTEEYVMHANDQTGIYNMVFRKIDEKQAEEELRTIETDAEKQNADVKTVFFNGVKATEITFSMPDGDYVNQYRTFFLYKNNYLIGVSLVSYDKQLADLLFKHLKENFKLKI